MSAHPTRDDCVARDAIDPLRAYRDRFTLPADKIYLDGNSLGALPRATATAIQEVVAREWGQDLIGSWNTANWVSYPQRLGDQLAPLVGASDGEVVVTDSTSVNLFKLIAAILSSDDPALNAGSSRTTILSERGNFPTDLYIAEGVNRLLGGRYTLRLVEPEEIESVMDTSTKLVILTQVDYRTGRCHPMQRVNARAAAVGAPVLWDLSHSAGALPVNLNADGAQFAVGCGYKYLNGGPGAPAFCYVAKKWQTRLSTPLSGWFAHARPFAFEPQFEAATGIERFLCGTPPVLAMAALKCGLDTFEGVDLGAVRQKSLALTRLFSDLVTAQCAEFGLTNITPSADEERGSHVSFSFAHGYAAMQALIARGVIGDFRAPDVMRFGFTPLYTRFVDCWDAADRLQAVLRAHEYELPQFIARGKVT